MTLALSEAKQPITDNAIVERIFAAVVEQKLSPGAKLAENALCDVFNVSRTQIRRILVVLAERGVVTLRPNRGAFVRSPSSDEARDVFAARRTIERAVMRNAAAAIDAPSLASLREIVAAGVAADAREDRRESIRLSGQFHIRLAEIAGNSVLTKFLEDLVARTSLIIALYGSKRQETCLESEHEALIGALSECDPDRAAEMMDHHLRHIEEGLDMREPIEEPTDIRKILGS